MERLCCGQMMIPIVTKLEELDEIQNLKNLMRYLRTKPRGIKRHRTGTTENRKGTSKSDINYSSNTTLHTDTSTETPAIETKTQQNIEDTTNKNNTADTRQTSTQDTNIKHTKDNELQLVDIVETKTHNSVTSSTTSHEYCTPPLSPDNDDISNPNTVELEELNETL